MYTIINATQKKEFKLTGNWPGYFIEYMLNNGDDLIVISTYSNTIKIPTGLSTEFEGDWEWKEYNFSPDVFVLKEG